MQAADMTDVTPTEDLTRPRARTGGRSAEVKQKVIAATVVELEQGGFGNLSIQAVAERSGVHQTSIYRRWKSREWLAAEATFEVFRQNTPIPDTGSLLEDLVVFHASAGRLLRTRLGLAAMELALSTAASPQVTFMVRERWTTRFASLNAVFERGTARGQWPGHVDPTPFIEALIGVMYLRVFLLRQPVDEVHLRRVYAALLDGHLPPTEQGHRGAAAS